MKRLALCVVVLMLSACGLSYEPESQKAFKDSLSQLEDEYDEAKSSGNQASVEAVKKRLTMVLKEADGTVVSWAAWFEDLYLYGDKGDRSLILRNGDQTYSLKLFDAKAIEYAKTFESGDEIIFSGDLGERGAVTITSQTFYLYPTSILKAGDKKGANQDVEAKLAADAAKERKFESEFKILRSKAYRYSGSQLHSQTGDRECRNKIAIAEETSDKDRSKLIVAWYKAWFVCAFYAGDTVPSLADYKRSHPGLKLD